MRVGYKYIPPRKSISGLKGGVEGPLARCASLYNHVSFHPKVSSNCSFSASISHPVRSSSSFAIVNAVQTGKSAGRLWGNILKYASVPRKSAGERNVLEIPYGVKRSFALAHCMS